MAEHERTIPSRLSRLAVLADQTEATMFETSRRACASKLKHGRDSSRLIMTSPTTGVCSIRRHRLLSLDPRHSTCGSVAGRCPWKHDRSFSGSCRWRCGSGLAD